MKYADKVIDLLSSYPNRGFRMKEIVNYVSTDKKRRCAVRRQVLRIIEGLEEANSIEVYKAHNQGEGAEYQWKNRNISNS